MRNVALALALLFVPSLAGCAFDASAETPSEESGSTQEELTVGAGAALARSEAPAAARDLRAGLPRGRGDGIVWSGSLCENSRSEFCRVEVRQVPPRRATQD